MDELKAPSGLNRNKQEVGVFGIGAIGSIIAYELHRYTDAIELYYFNRSPKSAIKIIRKDVRSEIPIDISATLPTDKRLDWLIICLKEYHFAQALERLPKLIAPKTKIAVIRNGLNLKYPLLSLTSEANILECLIDCPTQPRSDGYYISYKRPSITLSKGWLADEFMLLFQKSGVEIRQVEDFHTESWKKVCESSALGAILCLSGETCWIFEDERLRDLYVELLTEGLKVARADGAIINDGFLKERESNLTTYPKDKGSSMLTDRMNGTPIELGAKNKIISDLGKRYGIQTPINDWVVTLLSLTNRKGT